VEECPYKKLSFGLYRNIARLCNTIDTCAFEAESARDWFEERLGELDPEALKELQAQYGSKKVVS